MKVKVYAQHVKGVFKAIILTTVTACLFGFLPPHLIIGTSLTPTIAEAVTVYGSGPAVTMSGSVAVNYQATVKQDWNLCSSPWTTVANYSNVDGVNYVGKTVTVKAQLSMGGSTVAALITLSNGKSYWVDQASLTITSSIYGNGPALNTTGSYSTNYTATVLQDWNLMSQPWNAGGVTLGNYSSIGSTSFVGQTVTVNAEYPAGSTVAVLVTLSNGRSYWVDGSSLGIKTYGNGPGRDISTANKVNYTATIKANWNLMNEPWTVAGSYTIAWYADILGSSYLNQAVTVSEEVPAGSTSAVLVTLSNGKSYWVDKSSLLIQQYPVISATQYIIDAKDPSYWQDFRSDGSRIYTIKPTATSYPLYSGSFGSGTVSNYSANLVGTYYLAAKEEVVKNPDGTTTTAANVSTDNVNWYWIDKNALSTGQDGFKTAYQGLVGTGTSGAIRYYVDPSDPLASEIQAAANKWNSIIPGLFIISSSPMDVNINFSEGNLITLGQGDTTTWANTQRKLITYGNGTTSNVTIVYLSNANNANLVANKNIDDTGTINIIQHELGHALGLGHSGELGENWSFYTSPTNLMYRKSDGKKDNYIDTPTSMVNVIKFIRQLGWAYTGLSLSQSGNNASSLPVIDTKTVNLQ